MVNISFNIKKEKIAVIIGIRLVKILALLTPRFLITYTQHIKANEEAKIDSCNKDPTKRTVGCTDKKCLKSKIRNNGKNNNNPIIF